MRLVLEKRPGGWDAFFESRHSRISAREYLPPIVDTFKVGKGERLNGRFGYADLMATAGIDHSQYYSYIQGQSGFTLGILSLCIALGYEVYMVNFDIELDKA